MELFVLGSGSLGNSLLVRVGDTRVVVDAGVGPRLAAERMKEMGDALAADAIVVTHHHDDHAAKLGAFARATNAKVFLHDGVDVPKVGKKLPAHRYDTQRPFRIKDIVVEAFALPHDAPQVAVRLSGGGKSVGVVTDLGHVPRGLDRFLGDCDEVLLESNYCPELLALGPYPPSVQRRVSSPEGHLSNADAAALIARLEGSRVSRVHLCHVSQHNNMPERALEVALARAKHIAVDVLPHGAYCKLEVEPPPKSSGAFVQLGLFG